MKATNSFLTYKMNMLSASGGCVWTPSRGPLSRLEDRAVAGVALMLLLSSLTVTIMPEIKILGVTCCGIFNIPTTGAGGC